MAKKPAPVYQIKVTLLGSKPPIWRRLLVPADASLEDLHRVIQAAIGWMDSHLHQFYDRQRTAYSDPASGLDDAEDEARYEIRDLLRQPKDRLVYEYDFGDSWQHAVQLEKVLPPPAERQPPSCVAGKRSGPPEDVGGVWGYAEFLEAISDPEHGEHENLLEWIGGEWDPEAFDLEEINRALKRL